MTGNDRTRRLIEGPFIKSLARLALPMMIEIVAMMAFNLADTFFVGRLGTLELAAMSFTFPVVLVIHSISRGLGVRATSALSRAIGQGDQKKVRRMTTDALLLSLIVVIIFVIAGLFTIEPLFRTLGADDEVLPLIKKYMYLVFGDAVRGNIDDRQCGDSGLQRYENSQYYYARSHRRKSRTRSAAHFRHRAISPDGD